MSDPAAPPAVRCARPTCTTAPVWRLVGRCIGCRNELTQRVCEEHREELTTAMFLFNVLSVCHRAPVTLVRLESLT
jgi:hypothetical protein